jgi:hypothetical protein
LDQESEVAPPINDSPHEKGGSTVIRKTSLFLKGVTSLKTDENAKSHSCIRHFSRYASSESGPSKPPMFKTIPSLATMLLKKSTTASMSYGTQNMIRIS